MKKAKKESAPVPSFFDDLKKVGEKKVSDQIELSEIKPAKLPDAKVEKERGIVITQRSMSEIYPLNDADRKKLFPNNPPPTMKQLRESKNKK